MFDQELYNQDMPAAPTQEGDLFHHYEIKPWEFSPRIYKIIGVALVANLLFFTGVAQTNLMTMRGCESPFVGRVCQVLDMAYVGTVLFGTEREYVDVAYEKTDLGDAEITFISMDRNEPLFEYPPGYFQPEPEQPVIDPITGFNASGNEFAPGIPSNPTLGNIPAQRLPKRNNNPTTGEADGWGDDEGVNNPTLGKGKNGRLGNNTEPNPTKSPEPAPTVEPTAPVADVEVTSRPYVDLGNMVNGLLENEAIALGEEFAYRGKGKLTKDGRLDPKTFRFLDSRVTNPQMAPVLKRAFEAISESGHLKYLELLSGKDLEIAISQDQTNLTAFLQSEVESDTRAKSIVTLLNLGLQSAKNKKIEAIERMEKENTPEKAEKLQSDKDELDLLKRLVINAEGKKLTINFLLPQDTAQQMIERKLADLKKKPKQSSIAVSSPSNNTAVNRSFDQP